MSERVSGTGWDGMKDGMRDISGMQVVEVQMVLGDAAGPRVNV